MIRVIRFIEKFFSITVNLFIYIWNLKSEKKKERELDRSLKQIYAARSLFPRRSDLHN